MSGYFDRNKFKLFMLDTGLLGAMLKLSSKHIVTENNMFSEYNGAFIENGALILHATFCTLHAAFVWGRAGSGEQV